MVSPWYLLPTTALAIGLIAGCAAAPRSITTNAPAPPCVGNLSTDTTIFAASAVSVRPALRQAPPPAFPKEYIADGLPRTVVLEFVVDAAGAVDTSTVTVEESNDFRLNKYLIAMLGASSYWPGCLGAEAVATRTTASFTYRAAQMILVPRSQVRPRN